MRNRRGYKWKQLNVSQTNKGINQPIGIYNRRNFCFNRFNNLNLNGYKYIGHCRCGLGPNAYYRNPSGQVVHISQITPTQITNRITPSNGLDYSSKVQSFKICSKCGSQVGMEALYCTNCGNELEEPDLSMKKEKIEELKDRIKELKTQIREIKNNKF